jgi:DNA-binding response OmpR family regulator
LVLPGMTGKALADEIRRQRSEICILFISGYSEEAIARHGVLSPGVPLLQKPFTPQQLAQELRTLIDQRTESPR